MPIFLARRYAPVFEVEPFLVGSQPFLFVNASGYSCSTRIDGLSHSTVRVAQALLTTDRMRNYDEWLQPANSVRFPPRRPVVSRGQFPPQTFPLLSRPNYLLRELPLLRCETLRQNPSIRRLRKNSRSSQSFCLKQQRILCRDHISHLRNSAVLHNYILFLYVLPCI